MKSSKPISYSLGLDCGSLRQRHAGGCVDTVRLPSGPITSGPIIPRTDYPPGPSAAAAPKKKGGAPGHMKPVALAIASHRGEGLAQVSRGEETRVNRCLMIVSREEQRNELLLRCSAIRTPSGGESVGVLPGVALEGSDGGPAPTRTWTSNVRPAPLPINMKPAVQVRRSAAHHRQRKNRVGTSPCAGCATSPHKRALPRYGQPFGNGDQNFPRARIQVLVPDQLCRPLQCSCRNRRCGET